MPVEEDHEPWPAESGASADLANDSATPTGPGPSSAAPVQPTEPQAATDDGVESETPAPDPLPEFDPRHRAGFEGLLFIGKLTDDFDWLGHHFTIRTMTTDEVLEVGQISAPWSETMAGVKAYQAAVVAACLVRVDGRPLTIPLTDTDTDLRTKFDYVRQHWFPPVLDALYERYLLLEGKAIEVIKAMGEASG